MKTVIEMAREADIEWDLIDEDEGRVWYITQAGLERFAELVRADAITDEREACARLADTLEVSKGQYMADVGERIRARSNT